MNITYPVNYSGYVSILRSSLLLVKTKTLSFNDLSFYMCFVLQAGYDKRYTHYATILRSDKEIAKEFGLNQTTVYRYRKKLIRKGLLYEENGLTKVTNYHIFEAEHVMKLAKHVATKAQSLFSAKQEDCASFQNLIAEMQDGQPQNTVQRVYLSSNEGGLSADDVEFIKESLKDEKE